MFSKHTKLIESVCSMSLADLNLQTKNWAVTARVIVAPQELPFNNATAAGTWASCTLADQSGTKRAVGYNEAAAKMVHSMETGKVREEAN